MRALSAVILVLVIITLAAYRFQSNVAEAEKIIGARFPDRVPHLAQQLLALHADRLVWERYRDNSWEEFRDAERAVPVASRPALYASLNAERRNRAPWLEPLPFAEPAASTAGAQAAPAAGLVAEAEPMQATIRSALEAYREHLTYAAKLRDGFVTGIGHARGTR